MKFTIELESVPTGPVDGIWLWEVRREGAWLASGDAPSGRHAVLLAQEAIERSLR